MKSWASIRMTWAAQPGERQALPSAVFAIGAIFPIIGFLFLTGTLAIIVGIVSSCVALFAIGAGTSLFTGHGVEFSGLRQIGIGLGAAAITFGIGRLIGVSLGG